MHILLSYSNNMECFETICVSLIFSSFRNHSSAWQELAKNAPYGHHFQLFMHMIVTYTNKRDHCHS